MKEKYSKEIIKLAKIAYKKGEVPVGAVITKNDKISKKDIAIWKRCVYTLNDRNKEL